MIQERGAVNGYVGGHCFEIKKGIKAINLGEQINNCMRESGENRSQKNIMTSADLMKKEVQQFLEDSKTSSLEKGCFNNP